MNLLPIEIITKVAFYLSNEDRKSFALVCKRFNKSIYFKELWQNVTYVIDKKSIANINGYFLSVLSSIKLFSVTITPRQLHDIIKYSPNLRELSLIICLDLFTDNQFVSCFTEDLSDIVKSTLSNLQVLNLSGNREQLTDTCLNCLLIHCHRLEQINLSELDIVNLSATWSPFSSHLNNTSTSSDWLSNDCLSSVVVCSNILSFANLIVQLKNIRHTLKDIRLCSTHVEFEEIKLIVAIPQLSLATLHLDNCKGIDPRCVKAILHYQSSSLQNISLLNTFPLPLSFVDTAVSIAPRLSTIRIRGNAVEERLSFSRNSQLSIPLQYLHLENCAINDDLINTLNLRSSLTQLSLIGCNFKNVRNTCLFLPRLLKLDLSRCYGFLFSNFLSEIFSMRTINVLCLNSVKISDEEFCLSLLEGLRVLSIVGCTNLNAITIMRCLKSLKYLKILKLQGVCEIDDEFLEGISHLVNGLEELDLSGSLVSDKVFLRFLSEARNLRKLRVDNCNSISKHFAEKLPIVCPYLQDVSMRNCELIENPIVLNFYDRIFLHELTLV